MASSPSQASSFPVSNSAVQVLRNRLVDENVRVEVDGGKTSVPLPVCSFWLDSYVSCEQPRHKRHGVVMVRKIVPLAGELARLVGRNEQAISIDSLSTRYLHGKAAVWEWGLPLASDRALRLIAVTVLDGDRVTPAQQRQLNAQPGASREAPVVGMQFGEFIAREQAAMDAADASPADVVAL